MKKTLTLIIICFLSTLTLADESSFLKETAFKQVVFLGESHSSARDHRGQLRALKLLHKDEQPPLLIVAEMFNETAAAQFETQKLPKITESFWQEQWGHPYHLYRDIFEWVQVSEQNITYLRPDPGKTKLVKKEGVVFASKLVDEFFLGPKAYRHHLEEIASHHAPPGQALPEEMMDRFFLVQCFWDEFMAWRIHELAKQHPNARICVLVGHGHLHPDFGVPARLARRAPKLSMITVGFSDEANWLPDFVMHP